MRVVCQNMSEYEMRQVAAFLEEFPATAKGVDGPPASQ